MSFRPKLIVTDIDGVWTDGAMYYGEDGSEFKRFHVRDGWGAFYLNQLGIPWIILTGEESLAVRRRGEKLVATEIRIGAKDKRTHLVEILAKYNLSPHELAYLGDDLNDFPAIQLGIPFYSPADAHKAIKRHATAILELTGGEGVFRELIEKLFAEEDDFVSLLQNLTSSSS